MMLSIALINTKAVSSGKAKIVKRLPSVHFKQYANTKGFNIQKSDTTLFGFYYVNPNGDALKTYPDIHEVGSTITV